MDSKILSNKALLLSYQRDLLKWYRLNKRDLPWRHTPDFYRIWISEIILQQTRVEQGLNYYLNFIRKFENVEALASADEDEILKLWEGLGYYSRARNLHKAAKQIVEMGGFPADYKGWLTISGVGPYTASAICSIVAGEPVAAVDGNVQRVLSRVLNYTKPVNSTEGAKEIQRFATKMLAVGSPGNYNQAVMELGARVCKPKNPDCSNCPIQSYCTLAHSDEASHLPIKEKKVKVRKRWMHFYLVQEKERFLFKRRGDGDVWNGLYQFPLIEMNSEKDLPNPYALGWFSMKEIEKSNLIWEGEHILSHQRLRLKIWHIEKEDDSHQIDGYQWINKVDVENLALPRPLRRIFGEYLLDVT